MSFDFGMLGGHTQFNGPEALMPRASYAGRVECHTAPHRQSGVGNDGNVYAYAAAAATAVSHPKENIHNGCQCVDIKSKNEGACILVGLS